jgi:hypothetical protein
MLNSLPSSCDPIYLTLNLPTFHKMSTRSLKDENCNKMHTCVMTSTFKKLGNSFQGQSFKQLLIMIQHTM